MKKCEGKGLSNFRFQNTLQRSNHLVLVKKQKNSSVTDENKAEKQKYQKRGPDTQRSDLLRQSLIIQQKLLGNLESNLVEINFRPIYHTIYHNKFQMDT